MRFLKWASLALALLCGTHGAYADFNNPPALSNQQDPRSFGISVPLTLTVATGGVDGANLCTVASPCATPQHAMDVVHAFDQLAQNATINVGTGSFAGFMCSGPGRGSGGNAITAQHIIFNGNGTGNTTLTAASGQIFNVEGSDGCNLVVQNLGLSVANGNYAIFAQGSGTNVYPLNLVITGGGGSAIGIHGEGYAKTELNATATMTIQGNFAQAITMGPTALMEFDAGGAGGFSCGTGLTTAQFIFASGNSNVQIGSGWTFSGCSGATGTPVLAFNASTIYNNTGQNIPGSGSYSIQDTSHYYPDPTPTLGTCANGAIDSGGTNYSFRIRFTGANSTCAFLYGKPSNVSGWFTASPSCVVQIGATSAKSATTNNGSTTGLTFIPSAALASGDYAEVTCRAQGAG